MEKVGELIEAAVDAYGDKLQVRFSEEEPWWDVIEGDDGKPCLANRSDVVSIQMNAEFLRTSKGQGK